jgi:hypothetical protein
MLAQNDAAGAAHTLTQMFQIDADGTTVRQLKELWQNDAGGIPRLIFSALGGSGAATLSPNYVQGVRRTASTGPVSTASVDITLARPSPTSLVFAFADTGWTVISPSALSTGFRSPPLAPGEAAMTTAILTATYATGPSAVSNTITLYAQNVYTGGYA